MAFGSILRKLTAFLSPKEPPREVDKKESNKQEWEPLELQNVAPAPAAKNASVPAGSSPKQGASASENIPKPASANKDYPVKTAPAKTVPEKAVQKSPEKQEPTKTSGKASSTIQYLKQNRKIFAILTAGIITLLFYRYVIPIYVILIFIAIASVSKMTQDWIPFVVGFDLVMFFLVLSGEAYGWKAALIVGPASSLIGSSLRRVSSSQFDTIVLPPVSYGLVAALIPYLPDMSLFWLGMTATIIYVTLQNLIFAYLRPDIFQHATFTVTSILFNYWLFKNFAGPLLSAISVG